MLKSRLSVKFAGVASSGGDFYMIVKPPKYSPKQTECLSIAPSSDLRRLAVSRIVKEVGAPSRLLFQGPRKLSIPEMSVVRGVP